MLSNLEKIGNVNNGIGMQIVTELLSEDKIGDGKQVPLRAAMLIAQLAKAEKNRSKIATYCAETLISNTRYLHSTCTHIQPL